MTRANGSAPGTGLSRSVAVLAREILAQGARELGAGSIGWAEQIAPRVEQSGALGDYPLEAHLAEIRSDAHVIATRAVRVAIEHPDVVATEVDVDHGLHLRLRLQKIAGAAAVIEHELRVIEALTRA